VGPCDLNAARFEHTATRTRFYKSHMQWNPALSQWELTFKDGSQYIFGENGSAPPGQHCGQNGVTCENACLQAIRDRYSNTLTSAHEHRQHGNITQITSPNGRWVKFTYDAGCHGRLARPCCRTSFAYAAAARRLNKTLNSVATKFAYVGATVVQERLGSGTVKAALFPGLGIDEVFGRTEGTVNNWFLPDGLGSTLGITDTNGVVQTQYTYDPLGQTTVTGATSTNPFEFTGRENDGTGLYYYRNRHYHPELTIHLEDIALQQHPIHSDASQCVALGLENLSLKKYNYISSHRKGRNSAIR
jgi:RHS repeat-associated protein